jgi:hypothetical protein
MIKGHEYYQVLLMDGDHIVQRQQARIKDGHLVLKDIGWQAAVGDGDVPVTGKKEISDAELKKLSID